MPSGKNHDRITLVCFPCLVGITSTLTHKPLLTFLVSGSFLFSGLMFGPDLDIYSIQFKRWGILRGLWLPYQKLFAHRSFFSHGFIIGTVIRIFYLGLFISAIAIFSIAIAQLIWGFDWNWQKLAMSGFVLLTEVYGREAIAVLVGLEIGAMSHSLADGIDSRWKSLLKKTKTQSASVLNRSKKKRKPRTMVGKQKQKSSK
jgi:uncharacterized metal-binding protein